MTRIHAIHLRVATASRYFRNRSRVRPIESDAFQKVCPTKFPAGRETHETENQISTEFPTPIFPNGHETISVSTINQRRFRRIRSAACFIIRLGRVFCFLARLDKERESERGVDLLDISRASWRRSSIGRSTTAVKRCRERRFLRSRQR